MGYFQVKLNGSHPPNPTWADIKQLGWAALLVVPFIALGSYGAARLVGAEAAFWVAVWLTALAFAVFALIVGGCLVISFGVDAFEALRRRRQAARTGSERPTGMF